MIKLLMQIAVLCNMSLFAPLAEINEKDYVSLYPKNISSTQIELLSKINAHNEKVLSGYRLLMCGLIVTGGICLAADLFPQISSDGNNSSILFPTCVITACIGRLMRDIMYNDY